MRKLHSTLGDKGGIGTSFIAALMAQYIRDNRTDAKPIRVPIVGGEDMFPTLKTLDEVVANTPDSVMIAVWINQKNGRVEHNGKFFEDLEHAEKYCYRIRSVTHIPLWRADMQVNVAAMLEAAVTCEKALDTGMFGLMSRQRLTMAKRYLYAAIEESGVCR